MIPSDSLDSHSDSLIMADNSLEDGTEDISVLNSIEPSVLCNDGYLYIAHLFSVTGAYSYIKHLICKLS